MSLAEFAPVVLKGSVIGAVFALGLRTRWPDVTYLLCRPRLLAKSLFSMNIVMPVIAALLTLILSLTPPLSTLLVALSLCPTPPLLPNKFAKAGGDPHYGVSLTAICAVLAIVTIPIALEVFERLLGIPLGMPSDAVAKLVATMMIVPLMAGVLVRRFLPGSADMLSTWISTIASLILLCAIVGVLVANWRTMLDQAGSEALAAIAAFTLAGLAVGHVLSGPDEDERTVLAIATASRHPGLAVAIIQINYPNQPGVLPLLLIYLLLSAVCVAPYIGWRKSLDSAPSPVS